MLTNCPAAVSMQLGQFCRPLMTLQLEGFSLERFPCREVAMQATVQITETGGVVACLDTDDDYAEDEDSRKLVNLRVDDLLDQCARVAIAAWFEIRAQDSGDVGDDE